MQECAHEGIYGAMEGRECLDDAWALQAAIEKAILSSTHLTGCLLDYIKFFDYFDVDFAWNLMIDAGFPSDVALQIANLMSEIIRYLKVGGHFDAKMLGCNGIPQGCSLSIMIANIYVTTLFNMLTHHYDGIEMGP